jgi:chorismate mutase
MMKNKENIDILRHKIDEIDKKIINDLVERFQIVSDIAAIKKELNLPALDSTRWQVVLESKIKLGQEKGLESEFVRTIYELIHGMALKGEDRIIRN